MDFDEILHKIGSFGRYQQRIFIPAALGAGLVALHLVSTVFIQATPEYRCKSPWYPNDTYEIKNKYQESMVNRSMPWEEEAGKVFLSKTKVFTALKNASVSNSTPSTKDCDQWVYDQSIFTKTAVTEFNLVDTSGIYLQSVAGIIIMFGMLVGGTVSGLCSDKFGRKKTYFLGLLMAAIPGLIVAWAPNVYVYIVFSFFTGASSLFIFLPNFVYGIEIVGLNKRVLVEMIPNYTWVFGLLLLALNAYFIRDWRILTTVNSCCYLPFLLIYPFTTESPRWQLSTGRQKEAEAFFRKAAKVNRKTLPDVLFNSDTLKDMQELKFKEIFKYKRLVLRTLNIHYSWFAIALAYYGLTLNAGNLDGDIFVNYLFTSLAEIPGTIFAHLTLNCMGRKFVLAFLLIFSGVCLGAACVIIAYAPEIHWLLLACTTLGKAATTGALVTVYVYTCELYPTAFRNTVMGTSSTFARVGSMLAPVLVTVDKLIGGLFGKIFPLLVFGILTFIAGGLTFALPETKGVPIPESLQDTINIGNKTESKMYLAEPDSNSMKITQLDNPGFKASNNELDKEVDKQV